jgi:hypothetical protein
MQVLHYLYYLRRMLFGGSMMQNYGICTQFLYLLNYWLSTHLIYLEL